MHRQAAALTCILFALVSAGPAWGQGDWTTHGFDAQRSNWLRSDAKISPESMGKSGFELVWKTNLNEKGQKPGVGTSPALLDFYIGYRGFRSLGFFGTSSNSVVAMDTDLGRLEWRKTFDAPAASGNSPLCPGGMTSPVARSTNLDYPGPFVPRGFGRGTPAKSEVGEPFQGAAILSRPAPPRSRPQPPPPSKRASARRPSSGPANPFAPRIQWVYALTSDGKFHSLYASNGDEPNPPIQFLPLNAHAQGLIVAENVAYVSTTNGCGGVENGVWALDLASKEINRWKAPDSVGGTSGPAIGPDGTIYVTSGGQLFALTERTVQPKGSYSAGKGKFTSSPLIFEFKGKDLIAAASSDGRLHIVDAADLSKAAAVSDPVASGDYAPGALTSWEDSAGTRWLLASVPGAVSGFPATNGPVKNGAIVAWKVVEQNGAPTFQPGWMSRDMPGPQTPIVVNGVIFAVAGGSKASPRAVLYALDPATGKELWSSGNTMTASVRRHGLAAGGSRVYVATEDGMEYVFGVPIEH